MPIGLLGRLGRGLRFITANLNNYTISSSTDYTPIRSLALLKGVERCANTKHKIKLITMRV